MTEAGRPHDLPDRIAEAAGLGRQQVLDVFQEHDLPLASSSALPRPLSVSRLRIAGERTVEPQGPFDSTVSFEDGLTALVADNFRGKTSVLELITWCLRGTPRDDLQGVVKSWISELDCDALVAGRALGFRLTMEHGVINDGRILSAPSLDALREARTATPELSVTEVAVVQDSSAYADVVESLMLDLMNLGRLENASAKASSGRATHGWPLYFGALYLPAGGDRALLGEVVMGGVVGRLLQIFLDLPSAALLTRVKAVRDARLATAKAESADAARLRALQTHLFEETQQKLGEARARLRELSTEPEPAEGIAALADAVATAGAAFAEAERDLRSARQSFDLLRAQRQSDEKALRDLRESAIARALFHALDPVACPRCETPVTRERRTAEKQTHSCAVCTSEVVIVDNADESASIEQEAQDRLEADQRAEEEAAAQLSVRSAQAATRRQQLALADERLRDADQATQTGERAQLATTIARLEGMLSVLTPPEPDKGHVADEVQRVLDAAVELLEAEGKIASESLFDELNQEIVNAARRFGMSDLDKVKIDRAARLKVFKFGGPQEWFKNQSPGARLRLRIAVVVALLRVGARFGLATHPGLLLIDSPKAEEVQDLDATALFTELETIATDLAGLQVVLTTADEPLARKVLTSSKILAPTTPGGPLW